MVATMIIKDAAYYKAYREKKKAEVDLPVKSSALTSPFECVLDPSYGQKKRRCQAGMDGGACPNLGVEARIGDNKVYLCSMHIGMGKLIEA